MDARNPDEVVAELEALNSAHAQNEVGRDSFIGLGHTALFASSVSFAGGFAPPLAWLPLLIIGWLASVVGLLALTWSFREARRAIDARRSAIFETVPPDSNTADLCNSAALWSFPVALISIFLFVTANMEGRAMPNGDDGTTASRLEKGVSPAPRNPSIEPPKPWTGVVPAPRAPSAPAPTPSPTQAPPSKGK